MEFIYKGLEAVYDRHLVTDEEVDYQLERLRQQTPRIRVINDRGAQLGDELVLDYAGFCGDNQFEGGTAQYQTLTLGSGMFIPGFEEQLVGAHAGDEVTVTVTFPEQYHADELAGKEARFECLVHEIREKSVFDLDDNFAQELDLETMEQLREKLRESLQQYSDERGQMDLEDQLIRKASETLDFQPTEEEIEKALDEQMDTLVAQLSQQGLNLDMYCQFIGKSVPEVREETRGEATHNLVMRATIDRIVELENIEITDEDTAEALNAVCLQNGITMEQLQEFYDKDFENAINRSIHTRKAMTLVRENAVLTEKK